MPTQERQVLRGLGEIILASPRFATAPLFRRWHLRWGATDTEVAAPLPPMAKNANDTTAFRVAGMEPNRWMLWQKPNSAWSWKLVPLDGNRTRVITRLKALYAWRTSPGNALLTLILFEFGDFPMTRKLLLGVKRRAEQPKDA